MPIIRTKTAFPAPAFKVGVYIYPCFYEKFRGVPFYTSSRFYIVHNSIIYNYIVQVVYCV